MSTARRQALILAFKMSLFRITAPLRQRLDLHGVSDHEKGRIVRQIVFRGLLPSHNVICTRDGVLQVLPATHLLNCLFVDLVLCQ